MKTVISHFYNEEYMLPWWLMHHREIFDHGILIDYDSTDRSLEIIKEYCPTWQVVKSRNREFDAAQCDEEVMDYESKINGWKMCLNVTEYLIGDYSVLNDNPNQTLIVPCYIMVDIQKEIGVTYNESLLKQKPFGISYNTDKAVTIERCCRAIHNTTSLRYQPGRHFIHGNCKELQVLWYGYSPMTPEMIERKLQIQYRIPPSDKMQGRGLHHFTNEEYINHNYTRYMPFVTDLSDELNINKIL
jgi:hypothetical protein